MIIKCKTCGEDYDEELFPVCPFCLTPKEVIEEKPADEEDTEQDLDCDLNLQVHPGEFDESTEQESIRNEAAGQEPYLVVNEDVDHEALLDSVVGARLNEGGSPNVEEEKVDFNLSDVKDISTRALNVLSRNGLVTMSDLLIFIENGDLSELRNAGEKTISEINLIIERYNASDYSFVQKKEPVDQTKVSAIFHENRFNLFIRFCEENGIEKIDDLSGFDFDILYDVRGLGKGKIEEIIAKYQDYTSSSKTVAGNNSVETHQIPILESECLFEFVNEQLKRLDISFLIGLGIRKKQCELLREKGFNTLGKLEGIRINRLENIVGKYNIEKFRDISDLLSLNLIELFERVLTEASGDRKYIITLFRAEGYTLENIGDLVGLTRERIRQIVGIFVHTLDPFMDPIVDHFMNPKGFVTVQELLDIYDNDDFDKIIIYWCKSSQHVNFLDYADVFLPIETDMDKLKADLLSIAEDFVGEGTSLSEHLDDLSNMIQERKYSFLDVDSFVDYMRGHGYKLYGDYIVKGYQPYGALCSRIVGKRFPDGIKLYDSHDLNLLRKCALEEYGDIGVPADDRALSVRLSDYLLLRGRGIYTSEENVYIESRLLEELKDYIDNQSEAKIYYADLFAKFEGMISMMSNIDNYNYLHGVLKLYFAQDYDFSNRDYLTKQGEGLITISLSEKIRNLVIKAQRPLSKGEILKEFPGVTGIVLTNSVVSSDALFQWDYNMYSSMDLIRLQENEKAYLYNTINEFLDETDGYCSANMLFKEVSRCQPAIIKNNHMTDANNLYYLCAELFFDKFSFRRPHICRSGLLETMSIKNVALHMLSNPNHLYFSEYQNIAEQLQWSPTTTSLVFTDIEKEYFRVSSDLYIRTDQISLVDEDLKAIQNWMHKQLTKGFVSLITIEFDGLPELKYEWNSYLLRSIIDNYLPAFKIIETRSKDRRFERGIVLDADSEINDYVDLVAWLMKRNNFNMLPENKMLSLLVVNGLTYKMIPRDVYLSDKLIYKDEFFELV